MFLTLLRKDWRLAKPVFMLTLLLLFSPLLIGGIWFFAKLNSDHSRQNAFWRWSTFESVVPLIWTGFMFSIFTAPAVAATAFGRERRERTNDFLTGLAIPRRTIVASKLVVSLLLSFFPILCALLTWFILWLGARNDTAVENILPTEVVLTVISIAIGSIGFAWFLSCLISSEVFATAFTLAATFVLSMAIYGIFETVPSLRSIASVTRGERFSQTIAIVFLLIGFGGLIAGTTMALRRRTI